MEVLVAFSLLIGGILTLLPLYERLLVEREAVRAELNAIALLQNELNDTHQKNQTVTVEGIDYNIDWQQTRDKTVLCIRWEPKNGRVKSQCLPAAR